MFSKVFTFVVFIITTNGEAVSNVEAFSGVLVYSNFNTSFPYTDMYDKLINFKNTLAFAVFKLLINTASRQAKNKVSHLV
jgi:hypothetical protein